MTINNWHDTQDRTEKNTFKPKWTPEIIKWIIEQLNEMVDFVVFSINLSRNMKYAWLQLLSGLRWLGEFIQICVMV